MHKLAENLMVLVTCTVKVQFLDTEVRMRALDDKIQRKLFLFNLLQVTINKHLILYYDSIDRITIEYQHFIPE